MKTKINFNFKKIASAASSLLMIGSTVALAAAANYPAPFVSGGTADVAFVYGAASSNTDLAAALDLSSNLGGTGGNSGGGVTGEAFPLFTTSTELYLNSSLNIARNALTSADLPIVLADGSFSGNVEADFTQTIQIAGNPQIQFSKQPTSDNDPTINLLMGTSASNAAYNSTLIFNKAVNFTHADSKGETFEAFGQEWTVGADTTATKLILYKSSEKIALSLVSAGDPLAISKITVEGKEYTLELVDASDTSATIKVTDSTGKSASKEIDEDESSKVNGLEIAVTYASESDSSGQKAEITVGSSKISLTDGSNVKVGSDEDTVDGTTVDFVDTFSTGNITQIRIQTFAPDSDMDAIVSGGSFTDPAWGSFKLSFAGLSTAIDSKSDRETISFANVGDDELSLKMTDYRDNEKTFVWYENDTAAIFNRRNVATLAHGNDPEEKIKVAENDLVNKSAYVFVGNDEEGYLLQLKEVTNDSAGYSDDKVVFGDVFDSTKTYSATIGGEGTGTLVVGGKSYTISYVNSRVDGTDNDDSVRINNPDSATAGNLILYPTIETSKGAKVSLYTPLTINLTSGSTTEATVNGAYWNNYSIVNHALATNVTGLIFPDGDGYNTATAVSFYLGAGVNANGNVTVGGVSLNVTGTGSQPTSTTITSGALVFNVTASGNNMITVFLVMPDGGNLVVPGAIVWEEEEDNTNVNQALVVKTEGAGVDADGSGVSTIQSTEPLIVAGDTVNSFVALESNSDLSQVMTLYGSLTTLDQSETDQKTATISYPDEQVQAMIYVAEESASITSDGGNVETSGIVSVSDSEVSTVSTKNLIVLGGSCVNTVARDLLGSKTAVCGADFTAKAGVGSGQFLIQSFDSPFSPGSKVALLVAGFEAGDTKNAATYLRTQTVDTTVGKKYIGTSTTEAKLIV